METQKGVDSLAAESLICSSAFRSAGAIEHRDRPNTPVKYFTQADVNSGKLVYRPPQAPSHLQELYQYSFMGETAAAATHVNTPSPSSPLTKCFLLLAPHFDPTAQTHPSLHLHVNNTDTFISQSDGSSAVFCRRYSRCFFTLLCSTRSSPLYSLSHQGCRSR